MLQLGVPCSDKRASRNAILAAVSRALGWRSLTIFHLPGLHAQAPVFCGKIKTDQSESGCALFEIHPIWIGILELGIFKVKFVNKKGFQLGEWKGSPTSSGY